ncbi:MAG: AAA-like domain-containing protein [Nostoc sp. ChiQUE01a]|nr:AAA-like domain-containing protein [Nostoc sp. ChiQUE01a]
MSGLDNNYALLVGVGKCFDERWSLAATVNDVEALKSLLIDSNRCGYIDNEQHVRSLHDEAATKEKILAGLKWLEEKAKSDSEATVVIYYSGHGYLDKHTKKYYLVPHDNNNLLPAEDFNQALQKIQPKRLLVVIDSCHAEGMTAKDEILPMAFFAKELFKELQLNKLKEGEGRAVFSSSTGEQNSWIVGGKNSIYTYHFLEALQGAGNQLGEDKVLVSHLRTYLEINVPLSAQKLNKTQTPVFEFEGDFPVALLPENFSPSQFTTNEDLYIEQPVVKSCYDDILKSGCLLRIQAPWKMGKTTLMSRIQQCAANDNRLRTAVLNLRSADFESLEKFLKWFCISVSKKLNLTPKVDEYWSDKENNKLNCQDYFEKYLLQDKQPLALFLDDVDKIFAYGNIAKDFLNLIRVWHEAANSEEIWKQFRVVMIHTEIYYEEDINQSSLNVGRERRSTDLEFSPKEVQELGKKYGLDLTPDQVKQLMDMVGGHPYLVATALDKLKLKNKTIEELLHDATTQAGIYRQLLHRYEKKFQEDTELRASFKKVVMADKPIESHAQLNLKQRRKLENLGLVKLQGNGVVPCYELYRKYFRTNLGESDEYST